MRRLLLLGLLSLAACKHSSPPPEPPGSGVYVRFPGGQVNVANRPRPSSIDDAPVPRGGNTTYSGGNVATSPRPFMVDETTAPRGGPAR